MTVIEILVLIILGWIILYLIIKIVKYDKKLSSRGIDVLPIGILLKTTRLNETILKAESRRKTLSYLGYIGLFYSAGLGLYGLYFLASNLLKILSPKGAGKVAAVAPLIPGITFGSTIDELITVLIVIAIALVVHEGAHALLAVARGIRVKSTGVGVMLFFPLGFVELDDESMMKAKRIDRLLVYGAGTFANFLTWIVAVILLANAPILLSWGYSSTPNGVVITHVIDNTPASLAGLKPGDAIIQLNKSRITDINKFTDFMSKTRPEQTLMITLVREDKVIKISLTLGKHPRDPERGFIGIGLFNYYPPKLPVDPLFPYRILIFLNWLNVISISVAVINALPIPVFDGDKIWYESLSAIGGSGLIWIFRALALILLILNLYVGWGVLVR